MNKEKEIISSIIGKKKSIGRIALGVFVVVFFLSSILYLPSVSKLHSVSPIQFIINMHSKYEIFTYLKDVQAIEDDFYEIVNNEKLLYTNGKADEKSFILFYEEAIPVLEQLMIALAKIDTNPTVIENYQLFSEEIKSIRDMMVEKKFAMEYQDSISYEKAMKYTERYTLASRMRRENLKSLFDRYKILYIDLGDKIKYKVK
ncbi:MAG: hypothetical protein FH760_04050 [Geosporobacter ferrireducens]|nr:hypothetical protein [Geosporobacter ferrireducens]